MKKWVQWFIFILFQGTGILFMGLSIANCGKVPATREALTIVPCIICYTISLTVWYRYKLRLISN